MNVFDMHISKKESFETVKFTSDIDSAIKYLVIKILLRFSKKEKIKQFKNISITNIKTNNVITQKLLNVIGNPNNKEFYFKRYFIRGKNINEKLINKIDKFQELLKPEKLCIYIFTTESGLTINDGKNLRKHLTYNKKDSPIVFEYFNNEEKKGSAAYIHLIAINTDKNRRL